MQIHIKDYSLTIVPAEKYQSFNDITRWSFRHATAELGVTLRPADEERVMKAYNGLDTFPDANSALDMIAGAASLNAYIFSNGTASMLASSMATSPALAKATAILPSTKVISVEELGVFKPDPCVYQHLVKVSEKEADPGSVWLVSSNPFDACGAVAAGLKSAWVDRTGKGWIDGLANGTGYNPTIVVGGVDEAVKEIMSTSSRA